MAILSEVFEKVAAADPLDSEERVLWLNFLNGVMAAKDKVVPMAQGQSIVTALSQITNNAGRLTRGEYISPANANIPYPEDAGFTGVVQDSDGIRGINEGKTQFDLRASDGKVSAAAGLMELSANGIVYSGSGIFASTETGEDKFYIGGLSIGTADRFGIHSFSEVQEIVTNGDFSAGFDGWTQTGTPTISTDAPDTGSSARLTKDDYVTQTLTVVPNTYYLLTIYTKAGPGTFGGGFITPSGTGWVSFVTSSGVFPGNLGLSQNWMRVGALIKSDNVTSATITFKVGNPGAGLYGNVYGVSIQQLLAYTYSGALLDGMGAYRLEASSSIVLKSPATEIIDPVYFLYSTTPSRDMTGYAVGLYSKSDNQFYKYSGNGTELRLLTTADIGFDANGAAVFNEAGSALADVRMESDTEENMFLLDANGDTDGSIRLGGTTNSTKYLKGGRYSHLGTARKTWTKHTAASVTVTAGTSASVVAALQTMADGSFYTLTEAAATPGMDLIVDFTSVSAFEKCRVLGGYNGVGSHAVAIQVYNWSTAAWDTFNAMQAGTWNITTANGYILGNYEFRVYDDTNYIGTGGDAGKVRVRFYHTMAGNASHSLYLDEVSLRQ